MSTIRLSDVRDMAEIELFGCFPSIPEYICQYAGIDNPIERRAIKKMVYELIRKSFPEGLDLRFGYREASFNTFQYWVVPKYKAFGETNRAFNERNKIIEFLNDWISVAGDIYVY